MEAVLNTNLSKAGFSAWLNLFKPREIVGCSTGWGTNKNGVMYSHVLRNWIYSTQYRANLYPTDLEYNAYDSIVKRHLLENTNVVNTMPWAKEFYKNLALGYPVQYGVVLNDLYEPVLEIPSVSRVVNAGDCLGVLAGVTVPDIEYVTITSIKKGYYVPVDGEIDTVEGQNVGHAKAGEFVVVDINNKPVDIFSKYALERHYGVTHAGK